MSLTVLSIAYPLAPVTPDAAGGAEQILSLLGAGLMARGHHSLVIASEPSKVAGRLLAIPEFAATEDVKPQAIAAQISALRRHQAMADVVHIHSLDFAPLLPHLSRPTLVTLHMPFSFYAPDALRRWPDVWLNCVSQSQHTTMPPGLALLPPIANGIDLARFGVSAKRRFVLWIGRICPEKGVHCAIAAAQRARTPLVIAGEVFGYDAHRRYFETHIRPHLGNRVRFVGPVGGRRKRHLLASAQAVLIPALVDETSSLVAREAAACGTSVIAFRRGALPETVVDGVTGRIVSTVEEMAQAIRRGGINSAVCRAHAERHFSHHRMIADYLRAYGAIYASSSSSPSSSSSSSSSSSLSSSSSSSPGSSSRLTNL